MGGPWVGFAWGKGKPGGFGLRLGRAGGRFGGRRAGELCLLNAKA